MLSAFVTKLILYTADMLAWDRFIFIIYMTSAVVYVVICSCLVCLKWPVLWTDEKNKCLQIDFHCDNMLSNKNLHNLILDVLFTLICSLCMTFWPDTPSYCFNHEERPLLISFFVMYTVHFVCDGWSLIMYRQRCND